MALDDGAETGETDRSPVPLHGEGELALPPFDDLLAPEPLAPDPPPVARWSAFIAIAVGGILGLLIGYGIGDLMASSSTWAAVGAVAGATIGALGVGVVANLALRAMGEWREMEHPEHGGDEAAAASTSPQPGETD